MQVTDKKPTVEIVTVALSQISDNPANPRASITPEDVRGLADNIEAVGLLQLPVVIRTGPNAYELRAGHRRLAALRLLDAVEVDVMIRGEFENQSLELALSENGQREALDPFAEAAAVEEVLANSGGISIEAVAKRLGRSPKWVARRANLSKFSPGVREVFRETEGLKSWPVAWLEEVALLAPTLQEKLFMEEGAEGRLWVYDVESIDDLRRLIREELATLAHATWDLEDDAHVPEAAACWVCPKASHNASAAVDLFGELAEGDPSELAGSVCTDRPCYETKGVAVLVEIIEAAREKHGDALQFSLGGPATGYERTRAVEALGGDDKKLCSPWQLTPLTKKKGGRPTLVLAGSRVGKISYQSFSRTGSPTSSVSTPDGKKPKLTIEDRLAKLAKKRTKALLAEVLSMVEKCTPRVLAENPLELLTLVAAYGTSPVQRWQLEEESVTRSEVLWLGSFVDLLPLLASPLLDNFRAVIRNASYSGEPDDLEEGRLIAGVMGLDWDRMNEKVEEEIPVPPGLAKDIAKAAGTSIGKAAKEKTS